MAEKVIMPKQGLQMTEGTILKWLVKEGEACEEGKPLFEMETDKLTITMDAPATGTLLAIVHGEGDVVPITEIIGVIGNEGEDISAILAEAAKESGASAEDSIPATSTIQPAEAEAPVTASPAPPAAYDFDVAVLGAGPGGYVAAIRCAQLGLKTAIVENREMGGTCLNRGCIPTKALLHSAEVYEEIVKEGKGLGVLAENVTVDYKKVAKRKDKIVKQLSGGVGSLVKARKVTILNGTAALTGKNGFTVDGKPYTTEKMILATGSEPIRIPIPGIDKEGVMNSDGVLASETLPESVVIIGGGVIGIEFATLYSSFGKKVTVVEALPRILNTLEEEVSSTMQYVLENKGVEIHTGAKVTEIKDGLKVVYEENGKTGEAEGEAVVVAIGRRPLTAGIGLETAGVNMTEKGFVVVNEKMETSVPNIYAIGDITGKVQLAHVASAQGLVAAANAAGKDKKMSYDIIPSCIYSNPEIAAVGLTEAEAKAKGLQVKTGTFATAGNGRSKILGCQDGYARLVTEARTGEILGATIVAPHATDMIAEIVTAMKAEATVEEIADAIHPHPTVSEIIMEAAHDVDHLSVHKL
ncbi:MAG: dihydrolipoyl dehydrogenase [Lachnospiraceae bacterium]|nr:dihydrolipoyl dehydrogenase [Lachnospiraceae bacterium]